MSLSGQSQRTPSGKMFRRNLANRGTSTTTTAAVNPICVSLRTRALDTVLNNANIIFGEDIQNEKSRRVLASLPPTLKKEVFSRLLSMGRLNLPLFANVISSMSDSFTSLDFKSLPEGSFNDADAQILEGGSHLRTLFLTQVSASSTSLSAMFAKLHRLTTLEFTGSLSFDDAVLVSVALNCPCLKVLNVRKTTVGDEGMQALAQNHVALTALDIVQTKVSMKGIKALHNSLMKDSLTELFCGDGGVCLADAESDKILEGFKNILEYGYDFGEDAEPEARDSFFHQLGDRVRFRNISFSIAARN